MKSATHEQPRLERNIVMLGLVSAFTDIAGEMIVPVLPIFLATAIGAPMAAIGLIEGLAESTASILRLFAGWLSDRTGRRKPIIILGYSLGNGAKPLLALATTWPQVLLIRFADRFGKGIRGAPRDALIADSAPDAHRGRAFGIHRSLETAGAAVGPLVAALILALGDQDPRLVFWAASVPGVLAVMILIGGVAERSGPVRDTIAPRLGFRHLGRPFTLLTIVATMFALGNSSDAFIILRTQDLGVPVPLIPIAYFGFNLVATLLSTPAGILSDRLSRRGILAAGYALFALVYLGFALASGPWTAVALFALYGGYYALTEGVARALVVDLVPSSLRATAMGTFATATGVALLPASLLAGALWQFAGAWAPFVYGAALAALASVLLLAIPLPTAPSSDSK